MAQIVTITNPLTGQPAQVDQLDHTAQEIDDAITRALPGGGIDTLLNGKAPAGYGLGKNSGMYITDGNEAVYGGNYYWGNTTQNLPFSYGCMDITVRSDGSMIQTSYSELYTGCSAQRKCNDGTFGEWEWVNPPMQLGVEYRTTERYLGKPVYYKVVSCGNMPSVGSYKSVETYVQTDAEPTNPITNAFVVQSALSYYGVRLPLYNSNGLDATVETNSQGTIIIRSLKTDLTNSSADLQVTMKYTKSTD